MLLDEINANRRFNGPACSLRLALDTLTTDEAAEFRMLIYDPKYAKVATGRDINRALERRGFKMPENTVARHRRGLCVRCQAES